MDDASSVAGLSFWASSSQLPEAYGLVLECAPISPSEVSLLHESRVSDPPIANTACIAFDVAARPVIYDRPVVSETVVAERPDVYERLFVSEDISPCSSSPW